MAVVSVTTATAKPDRFEDFVAQARKIKAVIEKCGGTNVRLLAALVAGEATGSTALSFEADDVTTYGRVFDKFLGDPDGQALMDSTGTSASPLAGGFQGTMWVDVPL